MGIWCLLAFWVTLKRGLWSNLVVAWAISHHIFCTHSPPSPCRTRSSWSNRCLHILDKICASCYLLSWITLPSVFWPKG